jgi:DNA-binding GntR family transcriptional regulator
LHYVSEPLSSIWRSEKLEPSHLTIEINEVHATGLLKERSGDGTFVRINCDPETAVNKFSGLSIFGKNAAIVTDKPIVSSHDVDSVPDL